MLLGELGRRWTDVVGDRLAAECSPTRFDGGVLFVRASSAAWAVQLKFLSRDLVRRANEVLNDQAVRDVKVVVGEGPTVGGAKRGRSSGTVGGGI